MKLPLLCFSPVIFACAAATTFLTLDTGVYSGNQFGQTWWQGDPSHTSFSEAYSSKNKHVLIGTCNVSYGYVTTEGVEQRAFPILNDAARLSTLLNIELSDPSRKDDKDEAIQIAAPNRSFVLQLIDIYDASKLPGVKSIVYVTSPILMKNYLWHFGANPLQSILLTEKIAREYPDLAPYAERYRDFMINSPAYPREANRYADSGGWRKALGAEEWVASGGRAGGKSADASSAKTSRLSSVWRQLVGVAESYMSAPTEASFGFWQKRMRHDVVVVSDMLDEALKHQRVLLGPATYMQRAEEKVAPYYFPNRTSAIAMVNKLQMLQNEKEASGDPAPDYMPLDGDLLSVDLDATEDVYEAWFHMVDGILRDRNIKLIIYFAPVKYMPDDQYLSVEKDYAEKVRRWVGRDDVPIVTYGNSHGFEPSDYIPLCPIEGACDRRWRAGFLYSLSGRVKEAHLIARELESEGLIPQLAGGR